MMPHLLAREPYQYTEIHEIFQGVHGSRESGCDKRGFRCHDRLARAPPIIHDHLTVCNSE